MIDKLIADADGRMKKSVEALKRELVTIRTGRASSALVESIQADYYGVPTPINQLATISVPEARLLTIQPWDRQSLQAIEKAILKSELGITPTTDGTTLRLVIPPLTEERRKDLARVVRHKLEEGHIAVRNIRRDDLERLRQMEKNKEISEDDLRRAQDRLQKRTDTHIHAMDQLAAQKEREVMEV